MADTKRVRKRDLSTVSEMELLAELSSRFDKERSEARTALYKSFARVELPEWFDRDKWQVLPGDAGQANTPYLQIYHRREPDGTVKIKLFCPQFLRRELSMSVSDTHVGGSY